MAICVLLFYRRPSFKNVEYIAYIQRWIGPTPKLANQPGKKVGIRVWFFQPLEDSRYGHVHEYEQDSHFTYCDDDTVSPCMALRANILSCWRTVRNSFKRLVTWYQKCTSGPDAFNSTIEGNIPERNAATVAGI